MNGYSVGEILDRISRGEKTPQLEYLKIKIDEYRANVTFRVLEYMKIIQNYDKEEAMRWISQNVEEDLQGYVRLAYMDCPYDVLRKGKRRYKDIHDLEILADEFTMEDSDKNNTVDYIEIFKNQITEEKKNCSIFETHAHYNLDVYEKYIDDLLSMLYENGIIRRCIIPAIRYNEISNTIERFEKYDWMYYSVGVHPKYICREKTFITER